MLQYSDYLYKLNFQEFYLGTYIKRRFYKYFITVFIHESI